MLRDTSPQKHGIQPYSGWNFIPLNFPNPNSCSTCALLAMWRRSHPWPKIQIFLPTLSTNNLSLQHAKISKNLLSMWNLHTLYRWGKGNLIYQAIPLHAKPPMRRGQATSMATTSTRCQIRLTRLHKSSHISRQQINYPKTQESYESWKFQVPTKCSLGQITYL